MVPSMGLFINSPLYALTVHKRLMDLEHTSEIAIGLQFLQQMVEQGWAPKDRTKVQEAVMSAVRHLPQNQQELVITQLLAPLFTQEEEPIDQQSIIDEVSEEDEYVPLNSDFEVSYLLTITRSAQGEHYRREVIKEHKKKESTYYKTQNMSDEDKEIARQERLQILHKGFLEHYQRIKDTRPLERGDAVRLMLQHGEAVSTLPEKKEELIALISHKE